MPVACTPTGPELCFNAVDDNCNGVVDEGCGVGTGVLQFTLAWDEATVDLDLSVTDPAGARTSTDRRGSEASGLRYERNCPRQECHGQNFENIFYEGDDPPRGRYVVEVSLRSLGDADAPVQAQLSGRVGNHTFGFRLALSPGDGSDRQGFAFDL